MSDKPGHFCGVAGIYAKDVVNVPEKLFFSLFSLQHRGQESCGISYKNRERLVTYKDLGMVYPVLGHYLQEDKTSHVGIGHVRYSTSGGNKSENAQPIQVSCNKGVISLAHNGNLSNTEKLKEELITHGSIFQTTTDSELILHLISLSRQPSFMDALKETLNRLEGAYSLTMVYDDNLIGIRDPGGFRPLYIGSNGNETMLASETCTLDIMGMSDIREINPGEMVIINEKGTKSFYFERSRKKTQCVFELIYFARPDSHLFGYSVHNIRKKMGAQLAQNDSVKADIVIAVPDSGNSAAMGYASEAGLPFDMGFTRSHYTGRSFIMPSQKQRELLVRMKLNPLREVVQNKKVIMVDDSLVRGTTARIIVSMLREAGAKEIHLRLSSPEIKWSCYYGIDIPTREELISNTLSPEMIADEIGADSVMFLEVDSLKKCLNQPEDFCYACFNGEYPETDWGKFVKEL